MLSITSVLALFVLLVIASGVFFVSKRIRLPYTVVLVLVGLLLVPLVRLPYLEPIFGFLDNLVLTPELLFYIFLPILIFESAFNMNVRRIVENTWSIASLSVAGLLISASIIGTTLYFLFPLFGLHIPLTITLLFGAIISSTDPVAVLALFKEFGAPKRLTMIFEGESLFNDGTAVAVFMVLLAVAESGFHGASTVVEGVTKFLVMVFAGILLGVIMAVLFSRALRLTRSNEFVSLTMLIISAHLVFILSELINERGLFGLDIHVSSIIATTVSSLFLGNYARHSLSPRSDDYLAKSIEHLAFLANSLVFLLAGILFASTKVDLAQLWLPILATIFVVAAARAISVFAVLLPINKLKLEAPVPRSWIQLLAWGSLRGALAIIVVLLIPEEFVPAGWTYQYTPQQLLLALTIGCILATLFIKALTIGPLIRKLKVNQLGPLESARRLDLGMYYVMTEKYRFAQQLSRGFIEEDQYRELDDKLQARIAAISADRKQLRNQHGEQIFEQSLRLIAIDIEERYLKELYINDEISENSYRRIIGKLNLQREDIEHARLDSIDPSKYRDRKDVFDQLIDGLQRLFDRRHHDDSPAEHYRYYRAQAILSRKVVKILNWMQQQYDELVFIPAVHQSTIHTYIDFRNAATKKMDVLALKHGSQLTDDINALARISLHASGNKALEFFEDKGIASESMREYVDHTYSLH